MRVAFAGASGTGKSTLAQWVSETYNLPMNPHGARSVAREMGLASPYDADKAGRRTEFQKRVVFMKRKWEDENDRFVSDRTHVDNTVYTMMHNINTIDEEFLDGNMKALSRYTHIFFCPVSTFCNLGNDPARLTNMTYHKLFDLTAWAMLTKYMPKRGTKVIQLVFASLKQREEAIALWLGPTSA